MLEAIVTFAAEEAHKTSHTAFYVAGGLLALFAVVLSAIGITRHDFPRTKAASRAVIAIAAVLVAAAMVTAVTTA